MSHHRSAEEIEQEHLQALGPSLGPLYHALFNEVTWLHMKWLEYRKLYAQSQERIDLLDETAGFFFQIIQNVLWKDILLHIARLTDPPEQMRFKNLTLLGLPASVADPCLAGELRKLVEDARSQSQFAREWRNKRIAHKDLSQAIDDKATPLPGVSRANIEQALASFRGILNRLHASYLGGEVAYERFSTNRDADALLHHLAVAARFEARQRQRLKEGRPLPEDLEPSPEI